MSNSQPPSDWQGDAASRDPTSPRTPGPSSTSSIAEGDSISAPTATDQQLQSTYGLSQYRPHENNEHHYVASTAGAVSGNGPESWWKIRFWETPVWVWIALTVVFIAFWSSVLGLDALNGGPERRAREKAAAEREAAESATATTTEVPPVTTVTPTTVPETTPTTEPEPTTTTEVVETTVEVPETTVTVETTVPPLSVELVQEIFTLVFEPQRGDLISIVEDYPLVESVDVLDYDGETGVVHLEVTPLFDFDEGVRDDSWALTRAFSAFYADEGAWVNVDPPWSPTFDVKVSKAHYTCTGEQMQQLADSRFSRSDWQSGCQVR